MRLEKMTNDDVLPLDATNGDGTITYFWLRTNQK